MCYCKINYLGIKLEAIRKQTSENIKILAGLVIDIIPKPNGQAVHRYILLGANVLKIINGDTNK